VQNFTRRGLVPFGLGAYALLNGRRAAQAATSGFDWRQKAGSRITLALSAHSMSDALISLLPQFEQLTGIKAEYTVAPEDDFRIKLNSELAAGSGSGSVDVFMTGPSSNWEYVSGKWIENLQPYIDNPALTDAAWNAQDLFKGAVDVNRWTGQEFAGVGQGPLWAIPMNEEGYALHYRKDVLEKAGVAVPQTVEELITAANKLKGFSMNGKKIEGFLARGTEFWPTIITGYSAVLFGYGARDINPDGTSGVNSKETIEATRLWGELMKAAPADIGSYGWEQAQSGFAAGNAAFLLDADHMAAVFEDPKKSQVVGKVGYALPPAGPAGRASGIWLWSLGMNAHSSNKDAAWLFIQWASTSSVMAKSVPFGNINPTRHSVAASPTMASYVKGWGDYNAVWSEILDKYARWRWNPSIHFAEVGNRWALAVQEVVVSKRDAKQALDDAAADINPIIAKARGQ
jgi:multiple sugar transport system substrate-binding protein